MWSPCEIKNIKYICFLNSLGQRPAATGNNERSWSLSINYLVTLAKSERSEARSVSGTIPGTQCRGTPFTVFC